MGLQGDMWKRYENCCGAHFRDEDINQNAQIKRLKRNSFPQFIIAEVIFLSQSFITDDSFFYDRLSPIQSQNLVRFFF